LQLLLQNVKGLTFLGHTVEGGKCPTIQYTPVNVGPIFGVPDISALLTRQTFSMAAIACRMIGLQPTKALAECWGAYFHSIFIGPLSP